MVGCCVGMSLKCICQSIFDIAQLAGLLYLSHYDLLTLWYMTSNKISTWPMTKQKLQEVRLILQDFQFATFFHQNTSRFHDNLRRVSKCPLLHPAFTCHRSGTLDWCVMRATSADSSRLIHTILAHSSTLLHCIMHLSTFCHHRTSLRAPNWNHNKKLTSTDFHQQYTISYTTVEATVIT
jgi:hypothetical protein